MLPFFHVLEIYLGLCLHSHTWWIVYLVEKQGNGELKNKKVTRSGN